jgi:hypothetical protein
MTKRYTREFLIFINFEAAVYFHIELLKSDNFDERVNSPLMLCRYVLVKGITLKLQCQSMKINEIGSD